MRYVLYVMVLLGVVGWLCAEDTSTQNMGAFPIMQEDTQPMLYVKPDKKDKQPLDYANLFTKPNIEWKDIAKAKSGIFVGAGISFLPVLSYDETTPAAYRNSYPYGIGFNVKAGYTYFSNPYVGFRIYGEYAQNYSSRAYGNNGYTHIYKIDLYSAGISVLLDTNVGQNYDHILGVVVDVAYIPHITFNSEWSLDVNGLRTNGENAFTSGNKVALGLGFSYVFRSKHRFELMIRRLTDVRNNTDSFIGTNTSSIIFQQILSVSLGYMYVF